jgi:prepilin-type N-terminal cleavage/methylation domain-containing protein
MRRNPSGFTLVELLIVITIMGLMGMFVYPKLRGTTTSLSVRNARQQVLTMLVVARAASVQNGSEARFIRSGNVARVVVDSSGTFVTLLSRDLYQEHGVTLANGGAAPRDTIRFDSRGMGIGLAGAATFKFTNSTVRDSICVSKYGKVARTGCSA